MSTRRALITLVLAAFTAAGCVQPSTKPATEDAPAESTTTTSSTSTTSTSTSTSSTTSTTSAPATPDPLLFNISIHVEGYQQEDEDTTEGHMQFDAHVSMLEALADAADGGDGVDAGEPRLTFELSADFVAGATLNASTFITDMDARGHGIGVHADLGGQGYVDRTDFTMELVRQRDAIEAFGIDVVHVSGICSPSEWVEAAIDAGFQATTGMVEYCLSSYPDSYPLPCGDQANECHGAAVTDWEHKLHPWRTSTSTDWLTHDEAGELLMVAGESGTGVHCMSEHAAGLTGSCRTDSGDIPELLALIEEYLAQREAGRMNVLTLSWSIGSPPSAGFAEDLFAQIGASFDATELEWSTIEEIVARA